jgi:predicted nucleotidyltransferase
MNTIVWPRTEGNSPPADFEEKLCALLRGRVERAYVFGSYGTQAFRPDSDIDLILVSDTGLPFVERPRLFRDLYNLYPRLDILVYTADELASQLNESAGFWASVKETLRELPIQV